MNHNDSEDDDRSGCRNVSHCHQQFFSELHSPGRSHYTNLAISVANFKVLFPAASMESHCCPRSKFKVIVIKVCSATFQSGRKPIYLTAVKREKFAKSKNNASKERLSLLLFKV